MQFQKQHSFELRKRTKENKTKCESIRGDQEIKSTGRMPWHWEPKKDATSCEKPRLGAHIR